MTQSRRRLTRLLAAGLLLCPHAALAASASGARTEQSLNLAWVLVAGFLVMFMQLGFAMLETGFTRAKNAVNTMAMNLMIYPIGLIGFFFWPAATSGSWD
jgi:hypothetical protein